MDIIRDLGDGLVLRSATPDDTDALVHLQIHAFAHPDTGELDTPVGGWTRDLMSGKHPTFKPQDFLVVQDTKTGELVSCSCLISQTWTLEDIPFGVGRVEIVCTNAAYRKRGLVREQFRVLHEWSAQRGEMIQAITGIPFYYRQFGYEFAIEIMAPRRTFVPQQIPELKPDSSEKFRLRRAERTDFPFVAEMYERGKRHSLMACNRSLAMFEYEHFVESQENGFAGWWDVIETLEGVPVGILNHRRFVYQGRQSIWYYELAPSFEWQEVTPFVLRELAHQAESYKNIDKKPLAYIGLFLEANHPLFQIMSDQTAPLYDGYAWYVRVPELPAFLKHIAPVLEKRLAASTFESYSGTLRLNLFSNGIEFQFENGMLKDALPWRATAGDYGQSGFGNAVFPALTFLKVLFGYRSRAEIQTMFPDCVMDSDKTAALIDVLFPKRLTHILPIH